jgi:hypothetical protein
MAAFELFTRVPLREDFPKSKLRRGDIVTIVDSHEAPERDEYGYS